MAVFLLRMLLETDWRRVCIGVLAFMLVFTGTMTIAQRFAARHFEYQLARVRHAGQYGLVVGALAEDARQGHVESFLQYEPGTAIFDAEGAKMGATDIMPGDLVSALLLKKEYDRKSARANGHLCFLVELVDERTLIPAVAIRRDED